MGCSLYFIIIEVQLTMLLDIVETTWLVTYSRRVIL